ncbi:hypothetical protein NR798_24825 [Archangium gephyra]
MPIMEAGHATACPTGEVARELKWDKKAGRFTLEAAKPGGSSAGKK